MEQNGSLPFLDIKINCEENKFVTSVYQKPTFSGAFKNLESFISKYCGLIDTLIYRGFSLCSNMEKFHQESSSLTSVFKSNGYPKNLIDSCIKHFLDNYLSFSGAFKNLESFISKYCGLIDTLIYRGFSLCSNMEKFHQESSSLTSVFKSNGYPKNLIDSCIKHFLDNYLSQIK